MKRRSGIPVVSLVVLWLITLAGCAPLTWEMDYRQPASVDWPPAPLPLKARFIGEVRQFTQSGSSLGTMLAGRSEAGKLFKPVAVAVGADGRLAIADPGSQGVHLYVPAEKRYQLLFQTDREELLSPVSVCFGTDHRLYVADSVLGKVLVYDATGRYVKALDTAGAKPLERPTAVVASGSGDRLYVVDTRQHQIHLYDGTGNFLSSIGGHGIGTGKFNLPTHAGTDAAGNFYINDTMNFKVQVYNPESGFTTSFGSHGNGSGDFAMSKGIGADRWGVIYVVDTLFDCVQLFDRQGQFLLSIGSQGEGPGEFWMPSGLFIDHQDRLWVCDTYNRRLQVFQLYDHAM